MRSRTIARFERLELRRLLCGYHLEAMLYDAALAEPAAMAQPLRIDAGATSAFTDSSGNVWSADYGFGGGNRATTAFSVAGTSDDSLYYTTRYGKSFSYSLAVPSGQYTLSLLFAETYAPNQRKFDVSAEGAQILNDVDLSATYGTKLAIKRDFAVSVSDGKLDLQFTGVVGNATISGIQLVSATDQPPSPPSPPPPPGPSPEPNIASWKTVASSPIVRAESPGAVANGKTYVFGGFQVANGKIVAIKRSDRYDPATNKWTRIADMPEPITHSGMAVDGTTIWVVAGYLGDDPGPGVKTVYKYNTVSNTWSRGPDLPAERGGGAAAINGRKLHFFGGMDKTHTVHSGDHWVLDLDNPGAGWVAKAPLTNKRNHTAAAAVNGFVYCVGGQHFEAQYEIAQSQVDRYDPATDTWTQVASLPEPRSHLTSGTFTMNGKIIVIGGANGSGNPKRTVYSYNPSANTWTTIGMLPASRSTVVGGVLSAKQIISATGNGPSPTKETWIGTFP